MKLYFTKHKEAVMARDIWVTSDTHWNHANILNFKDDNDQLIRGSRFSSVQEMNEHMIDRWNSVVRPGDKVYHLGDVVFGDKEGWMKTHWPRLMGQKRLIVGNHDNVKLLASGDWFSKVDLWRMFSEFGLLLTHVPVHPSTLGESRFDGETMVNVHGHIHQRSSPEGPYRCVCVEQTDYTPVNIEELRVK
jgi:calcineurin-like phosphoesterase family protein